jgi:hypothetical protein
MGRRDKASQPNDVARKEAKKKELKKNKKQRQLVREIVAKQQDPKKLHLELDALREKEQACETQFARLPWIDKQSKVQASIREAVEYLEKNEPEKFKEYRQWKVRVAPSHALSLHPFLRPPTALTPLSRCLSASGTLAFARLFVRKLNFYHCVACVRVCMCA